MKIRLFAAAILACAMLAPLTATAAQIRAFVTEFTVSAPEAGTLKPTIQMLFTSRIAGDGIVIVGNAAEAEVIFNGSYTQLGKSFSFDAVAKLPSGRVLATAFDQGEGQEALIPALGRVVAKLKSGTVTAYAPMQAPVQPTAASAVSVPVAPQAAPPKGPDWLSQRITGSLSAMAPGKSLAAGREFFVAADNTIRLYRQEKTLTLLAEVKTGLREKVLSVDSLGPDQDGNLRAYVTIMDGDNPSSRVYSYDNGTLKLVAKDLPYLFRALALYGGQNRIYAQQLGRSDDFYGDVCELVQTGAGFELKNPVKLPRKANLYTFNMLRDESGKSYFVVLSESGYLVVYSADHEELWRSTEKFGGSETYYQRDQGANVKITGDPLTTRFLEQRITVTDKGEVILPQNSGFFVLGNSRTYSNYSVVSLVWNGVTLDERWRSKPVRNYLSDYFFEPKTRELVLLEVVQREGIFSKGGSAVRVIAAQ